jgi:hypothetical protein
MEDDEDEEADDRANRSAQIHRVTPGGGAFAGGGTESRLVVSRGVVSRRTVVSAGGGRRTGTGRGVTAAVLSVTPTGATPFARAMLSSTALRAAASASAALLAAESPDTTIR